MQFSPAERMAWWAEEFDRCVKCYACRQVCPLCYCERCIADKNRPVAISTSASPEGNFAWHITRAFHLAGRCVGCGECTRACPAGIPLSLLNMTLALAAEKHFGYRAGMDPKAEPLIGTYALTDQGGLYPMSEVLTKAALREMAAAWIAGGKVVAGPVQVKPGLILYAPLSSAESLCLEGFIRPANSPKEFVFPRNEKLCTYRRQGARVELSNDGPEIAAQILLAVRPCDAAALPILDHVFNWDYQDEVYNRRRRATTVVTLACSAHDESCFCTSVGLGPQAEKGSDVLLLDLGEEFEVRCLTDKGRALFAEVGARHGVPYRHPIRLRRW